MAPQSAVDRAQMAQAAQEIESKAQIVQGLRNTLEDHKAQVRAGWKGGAAGAFETVFAEFDGDFNKVIQALDKMHQALTHTRIQYESREQESHAAVSEVQRLLGGG
jgi:WXG100 family type VII secretion target